jgi:predicted RNase H-like HicB family nuclease
MSYNIEFEIETDGRWIAEIPSLSGVMAYGTTKEEAASKVEALALSWRPHQARTGGAVDEIQPQT